MEIAQSSLQLSSRLSIAVPSLVLDTGATADGLLRALAPSGARVEGMTIVSSVQDVSQASITVTLLNGFGAVHLGAAGFDFVLGGESVSPDLALTMPESGLKQIVQSVESLVSDRAGVSSFAAHTVTIHIHASLSVRPEDVLSRFVQTVPSGLGPAVGAGVRFVLGPTDKRRSAWLIAEPSFQVTRGLYLGCMTEYAGADTSGSEAILLARDFVGLVEQELMASTSNVREKE